MFYLISFQISPPRKVPSIDNPACVFSIVLHQLRYEGSDHLAGDKPGEAPAEGAGSWRTHRKDPVWLVITLGPARK